jgi:hypothetical protein
MPQYFIDPKLFDVLDEVIETLKKSLARQDEALRELREIQERYNITGDNKKKEIRASTSIDAN